MCSTVRVIHKILCYWTNTTGMSRLKAVIVTNTMLVALYRRNLCYGLRMASYTNHKVVFWYTNVIAYESHYHVKSSDLSVRLSACQLYQRSNRMYFSSTTYSWQTVIKRSHSVLILLMSIQNKTKIPLFSFLYRAGK